MTTRIHVGYEATDQVYDGGPEDYAVSVPLHHMAITGQTQLSGKTTTISALVSRLPEDFTVLVFRTKRGEVDFPGANLALPYFRHVVDWQYVEQLLEAVMQESLRTERRWIINATEGTTTLREVYENVKAGRTDPKVRGTAEGMFTKLQAYFEIILPQIDDHPFADELTLEPGVNVMELRHLSEEMQSLVISSCLEEIHAHRQRTVVVIPEAWLFLPQGRGNPVKLSAQKVVRQGAASDLYLWLDSQDVTTVTKEVLKSVGVWIMGRQMETNEVQRVIDQTRIGTKPKPDDIMTLPVGYFYVAAEDSCKKVYVQPSWLDENGAFSVATGVTSSIAVQSREPKRPNPVPIVEYKAATPALTAPGQNVDGFVEEISRLSRQKEDLALALAKSEAESAEWQDLAGGNEDLLEQAVAKLGNLESEVAPLMRLRDALMDVLETPVGEQPTPVDLEVSDQFLDQLASKVAERMDLSPRVVTLAPLEALRHQYQEEVVERMAEEIKGFEPRQRDGLKWLLAVGNRCSAMEVCRNLGIPTAGGSYTAFNKGMKDLVEGDWVSQDTHGLKSKVYEKVEKALAIYTPMNGEIDQIYQRLVAELG